MVSYFGWSAFGHFLSDQYFLLAGCNLKIKPTWQAKLIQIPDTHGAVVMFDMTTSAIDGSFIRPIL